MTDSVYYPIIPLFEHKYGSISKYADDEIIKHAKPLIDEVHAFVNMSYDKYAKKAHNVNVHRWDIKKELIAKRAFWVGKIDGQTKKFKGVKKRYAQWVVDDEGQKVDKLVVKGLDVVRSNFPKCFREFMESVLVDILHDTGKDVMNNKVGEFKKVIKDFPIREIMISTGVNNVEKYTTDTFGYFAKGTPAHVKAALTYNDMLEMYDITDIQPIQDGEKILWCYLKPNRLNLQSLALKGHDDPPQIVEFIEKNIDRDTIYNSVLEGKLNNFWLSLNWNKVQTNVLVNKFFKFS